MEIGNRSPPILKQKVGENIVSFFLQATKALRESRGVPLLWF
jgi:hypothetical protein